MSTHLVKLIVLRLFEWLLGPSRLDFLVPHRPFFLRAADPRKPKCPVIFSFGPGPPACLKHFVDVIMC